MHKPGIILAGENAGKWYIDTINRLVEHISPSFEHHALQIDFGPINALLPYKMVEAAHLLEPHFLKLEQNRQPYILANITLHEAVHYFSFSPDYFISLDRILGTKERPLTGKAVVLGTKYTMNDSFIRSLFHELEFITLSEELQDQVDSLRKIYIYSEDCKQANEIFEELIRLEVNHILIACTELSVAWNGIDKDKRWIDIPRLQCERLILARGN